MEPLRFLLVGIEQSAWEGWRMGPPAAAIGDAACQKGTLPFPVLSEPLFDPAQFDGVVFAIPNNEKAHTEMIVDALQADLPTLVLKMRPCADAGMASLSSLPERLLKRLFIGDQYRYQPGALAVRSALQSGRISHPAFTSWRCTLPDPGNASWLDAYAHLTLEDLAYHHLMTLTNAFDTGWSGSGTVYAASFNPGWVSLASKGYGMMLVRMDNGLVMQYETRWGASDGDRNFFGNWLVEGKEGLLRTNGVHATLVLRNGHTEDLNCPVSRYEGWAGIADHFHEMLLGVEHAHASPLASYGQYEKVYNLIHAGVRSMEENRAVRFS